MLHRLVDLIQPLAAHLGGPGLALIAFLDSSVLSFPEVPDFLLVWQVARSPALWPYYAAAVTAGSVAGCYLLYLLARKGGESAFRRRFRASTFERGLAAVRRYGVLAVVVPSLLPPPAPFKIFVILAGLSGIGSGSFLVAIVIGRGLRYFAEALLAYRYGQPAIQYISQNGGRVSAWVALAITVAALAYVLWRRTRRKEARV